mmetsp:Transcript_46648/g.109725  ORF Transcript_46648/g.109725 Transcript_46648/m.109725 type:complete len:249 (-) Transcript_46648:259-1005(-)
MRRDERHRDTSGDDSLEILPASTHASAMAFDQFPEWDGHLLLDCAGVVDATDDVEELSSRVVLPAKTSKPVGTTAHDGWADRDGLDVGNRGGASKNSDVGRKRGLQAWFALFAFQRFDQTCLLATNVRPGTTMDNDVEIPTGVCGILAELTTGIGLSNGLLESLCLVHKLAADVNVSGVSPHGITDHQTPLDELLGVVAHDFPVFASTRFTLVRIDDEIVRFRRVVLLGHEGVLQPRWEASTSSTTEA